MWFSARFYTLYDDVQKYSCVKNISIQSKMQISLSKFLIRKKHGYQSSSHYFVGLADDDKWQF